MVAASQPWFDWKWVGQNTGQIRTALIQHVELTLLAVGVGLVISLPLALLIWRQARWETPVYGVQGALFAIPSLALFAFLIPVTGLSTTSAEVALVSYTLLILTRNIVTGLRTVPPEVRDAATGMGYSASRRLLAVELPLALPTIIAGVRIAVVTTVGLVSVASYVGLGGGLGTLINYGQQIEFRAEVVLGALLSVALAAVLDVALVLLQRAVTPWARRGAH